MVKSQMDFNESDIKILGRIKEIFTIRGKQEAVKKALELLEKHGILDKEQQRRRELDNGKV